MSRIRAATRAALAGALAAGAAPAIAACGAARPAPVSPAILALQREARPIGRGPRFQSRARGPILGPCRRRRGPRRAVHLEVFADNRVVLVPTGIGVRGPVRLQDGRIVAARCEGALITVDPTGVVLFGPTAHLTLGDVFRSWGTSLSATRLAGFTSPRGSRVRLFVGGRPIALPAPGRLRLVPGAEIVLEIGPYVPPHAGYRFPPAG